MDFYIQRNYVNLERLKSSLNGSVDLSALVGMLYLTSDFKHKAAVRVFIMDHLLINYNQNNTKYTRLIKPDLHAFNTA
jgi:hypothetical protein